MNCHDLQDLLYRSDAPGGPMTPDAEAHLASCPSCGQLRQKLVRLEQAVRQMPVDAVLRAGQNRPAVGRPRGLFTWSARAAAVLLLGLGVWALMQWRSTPSDVAGSAGDPDVIGQLVAWNVDLAERPTAGERAQTFQNEQHKLRSRVSRAKLSPAERRLADQLLANGEWMTQHDDSLSEAERFAAIAQGLVDHMDQAARQGRADALDRLSGSYCMVVDRGIDRKLEKARRAPGGDDQQRIERLLSADQERQRKLQDLLERSPHASRKQLQRALKSAPSERR